MGGAVIIANHPSYADPIVLNATALQRDLRFIAYAPLIMRWRPAGFLRSLGRSYFN